MKNYTERQRREHLENWRNGELSKSEYALSAGIVPRTFTGWTWREKEIGEKQGFVEVTQKMHTAPVHQIVIEKGSVTVRLPLVLGIKELQTVFTALGGHQ